jgi:hypothetical protein
MSRRQYGFLIGLLIAWVWAMTTFLVAVGVVFAGVVGYWVARALEGDVNLGELTNRFTTTTRR